MRDINEDHAWGLFISVAPSSDLKLANSFVSQGKANHAMKIAATVHLAPNDTASLMHQSVNIRKQHGGMKVRLEIISGTLLQGKFVRHGEIDAMQNADSTLTSDPKPEPE